MFNKKNFIGHSGQNFNWKIECDSLSRDDNIWVVERIKEKLPNFCYAFGIPEGGTEVERGLRELVTESSMLHLIYDDVLTTGGSMEKAKRHVMKEQLCPEESIIGVVLFARIKPKSWIYPIWQMW